MSKRSAPEVNAGSMADIAFLLLIFFLVTTTIQSEKGMVRQLPPIPKNQDASAMHKKKNVFLIIINKRGDLLVDGEPMKLSNLKHAALAFIDNGGGQGSDACSYCQGKQDPASSDNPSKALVSIQYDRQTDYGDYIAVQNEVLAAYTQLRNRVSKALYGEGYTDLYTAYKKAFDDDPQKKVLKKKVKRIRELYPLNISEARPTQV